MSKLAEFRVLERKLAAQLAELEAMKGDAALQKEIEFETKLKDLMQDYSKNLNDIVSIIDPTPNRSQGSVASSQRARRERTVKRYKNPDTGEVVETKGGNHKVLKAWKAQHGADTVESWVI